jgi:hypothetical protein
MCPIKCSSLEMGWRALNHDVRMKTGKFLLGVAVKIDPGVRNKNH